ncbi:hypothetical protein HY572_00860 [Candidatus Micrarchaeota archaeon]|nr:hypothetical protein [Candidatus Micrarchaeota archaeon]
MADHGRGGGGTKGHGQDVPKREPVIFVLLLAAALAIPLGMIFVFNLPPALAVFALALIALLAALAPRLYEFKEYERGVIFRLGRFQYVAQPGWHVLFPAFQTVEVVDMRTQTLDVDPQDVITKEDIRLRIDAIAYIRIVDAKKAVIEVKDITNAVSHLLHGELRSQIGRLPMQDVLENMDELNAKLYLALKQVEDDWGIKAINVEITDIELPQGLEDAFRRREEAKQYKEKIEIEAAARREAVRILNEATQDMDEKTIAYLYLDTLKRVADGRSSKIILPVELSDLAQGITRSLKNRGVDEKKLAKELVKAYKDDANAA